ncbi:MAG: arginase [Legionellaceae bacterium]|nr:arginase [Legionellaceae bacterium]
MNIPHVLTLLGFASGIAANNADCALGPKYLYEHPQLFQDFPLKTHWPLIVEARSSARGLNIVSVLEKKLHELGTAVQALVANNQPFCVIGGDHSCAMGTWEAVAQVKRSAGDIGLIWIDAHLDAHTPETTSTQNIHGMPVAHLLGQGLDGLCHLFDNKAALKPENLCLIGIRSYEKGELALLKRLGVKIYFMEEVRQRGLTHVFAEARTQVMQSTCGFGVSIDMDAIDPGDAPGVGCPESGGISGIDLIQTLTQIAEDPALIGLEFAEYNPILDENEKTAILLVALIRAVFAT